MKVGRVYNGFLLKEERDLKDIGSLGRIFEHKKSGARLIYLQNKDDNKVFSVAFKTPPFDNTGLPHILEHSVLCGSKNYPVKEAFKELIKSSLRTFLNAMTYPDKTLYPVASRNAKDFANLMGVYLDAVFYPNIYEKEEIFMQEGWHHFLKNGELNINGVVYSEMKGVYSSPEILLYEKSRASLYSDTNYRFCAGGQPDEIPNLCYQKFLNFHKKHYHPENSYIYLYGDLDIQEKLEFLDSQYLSKFSKNGINIEILKQKPFKKLRKKEDFYSVSKEKDIKNGFYYSLNYSAGANLDVKSRIALRILVLYLVQIESAPLKKALLDKNKKIGESVFGHFEDHIMYPYVEIFVKNSLGNKEDVFVSVVDKTINQLYLEGLEKDLLEGCINTLEFEAREGDFDGYPKGLYYNFFSLSTWLYGGDPFEYFSFNNVFENLRKLLKTRYFEKLLKKYFIENKHKSFVILKPKKNLLEKREKELQSSLRKYKNGLSEREFEEIARKYKKLRDYQQKPDLLDDIKKIPKLKIRDLNKESEKVPTEKLLVSGKPFLFNITDTKDICYLGLTFDSSVVPFEKLQTLNILLILLGKVSTRKRSYKELEVLVKKNTGGCFFSRREYVPKGEDSKYHCRLFVRGKAFASSVNLLTTLLLEIILESRFDEKDHIKDIITKAKSYLEMEMDFDMREFIEQRLLSYFSKLEQYNEHMGGITFYHYLIDLLNNFDAKWESLKADLDYLQKIVFTSHGLVGNVVCEKSNTKVILKDLSKMVGLLPCLVSSCNKYDFKVDNFNEGILSQSRVNYVVQGGNFKKLGFKYSGKFLVLKNIFDSEYLWNELRVKGGAYGGYSYFYETGNCFFASYRDPNLKKTLEVYKGIPKFLRGFKTENMSKFVIGSIGRLEKPLTPSIKGERSLYLYFTKKDLQQERDEVFATKISDIRNFADIMEDVIKQNYYCVLGNERLLREQKGLFNSLVSLNR